MSRPHRSRSRRCPGDPGPPRRVLRALPGSGRPSLLSACALALAAGCAAGPAGGPRRAPPEPLPGDALLSSLAPGPPCPAPGKEGLHRWFVTVASRVVRARGQLARATAAAEETRDVLLFSCLSAKARVLGHLGETVARDAAALQRVFPPDPGVTGRLLASCEQARGLVTEARRCVGPRQRPGRGRPPGEAAGRRR